MDCIYLFALSFTACNQSGIALVSAETQNGALTILKNAGRYNGMPESYSLVQATRLGLYAENRYELLFESYTNAIVAYDAIVNTIRHLVTREEFIEILGYTPADEDDLYKKVDKEEGKGLSEANYTAAEKRKLANIDMSTVENIIETIKRNGVVLPIVDKSVDISVPIALSQLSSDETHRIVTDNEKAAWNDKYDKPSAGIPKSDLSDTVRESLNLADSTAEVIPGTASPENKLVDKNYVDSSISTASATFRGTSAQNLTELQFLAWANNLTHDLNDYVYWNTTDNNGNTVYKRYKFNGSTWIFEYDINNSSFSAAEWAAIQSGITDVLVTKLSNMPSVDTIDAKLARADDDHTRAGDDHQTAGNDHTRAGEDHTQAGNDHTRAEADHGIAADDHTQATADHAVMSGYDTRLGNVEGEVSQLGQEIAEIGVSGSTQFDPNFIFDNYLDGCRAEYNESVREIENGVAMYSSQQSAIDALKDAGNIIAAGRCGDSLFWQVNSNKSLRIYGKGRMYDYLKGTKVGSTKAQIDESIYVSPFMFYYCWHITPLRNAIEALEAEGYGSLDYKGVATPDTIPVASGKAFYMVKPVSEATTLNNFLVAANTGASLTVGNYATILKRNANATYWTKVDVLMDIDEGIVYDERTVEFAGNGAATVFNYADKLDVCNSVSIDGIGLADGWSYDSVSGNLTFIEAPADGATISCEFAQYVNPWYIYRIEKSYRRYVWKNGDTEVNTMVRNPDITTDRAWFDKTFAGNGYAITGKGTGGTPASITVDGIVFSYDDFYDGYCDRRHYLAKNPNEYTYNTLAIDGGITYCGDWGFYRNSALAIILPEGVTEIGIWCIRYSEYTKAVRFPSTLEKIGWYGCSRMTALEYIQFQGTSLAYCDDCCFHNCIALKGLVLPSSVTDIGEMFAYANHKMKIVDVGNADYIGPQSLQNATDLKVLRMDAVKSIGDEALQYTKIEMLKVPSTLESVGNAAFTGCSELKTLIIDSAIVNNITAFSSLGNLIANCQKFYVKRGIEADFIRKISANTGQCNGYDRLVKWGYEHTPDSYASGLLKSVASPEQYNGAHYVIYYTDTADRYKIVISGYNGHGNGINEANLWPSDFKPKIEEVEIKDIDSAANTFPCANYPNIKKIHIAQSVVPDTFHNAASNAPDASLVELVLEGVTEIKASAFSFNTGLMSLVIPDTVITIGDTSFNGISGSLTIGKKVKSIGSTAFNGYTSISIPDDNEIEVLGNSAFFAWSGAGQTKLYLPNVKTIGNTVFARFTGAAAGCTDIYIGSSITSIGNGAFGFLSGSSRVCNIHIAAAQSSVSLGTNVFGAGANVTWNDDWQNS